VSPLQLRLSELNCSGAEPSGQHLEAKSGLGLPTISFIMSVMTPLRGRVRVTTRVAEVRSTTSFEIRNMTTILPRGTKVTKVHRRLAGT